MLLALEDDREKALGQVPGVEKETRPRRKTTAMPFHGAAFG